MEDTKLKVTHVTGDEYLKIGEVAKPFWERGATGNPPLLVIFMGGVGAGKTTIRREQFANGFVHFDFGEIYTAFKKKFGEDEPRLVDYAAMASDMILRESINGKKNIVIEIIGESADLITPFIDSIKDSGYEISLNCITCDVAEAYKRHKGRSRNPDYLSAAHTQEATLSFIFSYFDLGQFPQTALEKMERS